MTSAYDVIVIGGGIHGAGVAQAAAARGHSVLTLEQAELAAGTSSRSSKLIHGGLRYLESGQYALVRECLRERSLLLKLAPDLVRLVPFHIPVYRHTRRRPGTLRLGLGLYGLLALGGPGARFSTLRRSEWAQLDGLDTGELIAVFRYWDAQTHDAALTRAVMHSAQELGAELLVPAAMLSATRDAQGATVAFRMGGEVREARAQVVINAAGPWANDVLRRVAPAVPLLPVELVQGTHVIFDVPVNAGMYYLEAPQDGRAVFVMPWGGRQMMVGTTETSYHGDPAAVQPLPQEISYLTDVLMHYFPRWRGFPPPLSRAFAGLRVLPTGMGGAFDRPRETVLHVDDETAPGVLTIYGGKLTAYRATAERVMERLAPVLPTRTPVADTRTLRLVPV